MHRSYPESHYDDQFCLKPPLLLWVATLYLSRAITLPFGLAIAHFANVDSLAIDYFHQLWSVEGLIPSAIAAVFLYTLFRRVPSASNAVRWIWARGPIFLAVSAVSDIVLLAVAAVRRGEFDDQTLVSIGAIGFDIYFLLYVLFARRVRDAIAEFPVSLNPAG
jgi:Protein of unknown function (DUF2919)